MKNLFIITFILALICGCSAPKMTNSIWCTMEPLQNGNNDGLGITSLYMYENGKMDVYKSIVSDSGLVVAPYLFARGTYTMDGNFRKEAAISVIGSNLRKQDFEWSGIIDLNKKSMLLIEPDSTATFYYKYGNITVE